MLTTITPYWGRPEMLRGWVKALRMASNPEVSHIIYFIGEMPPSWWESETEGMRLKTIVDRRTDSNFSIGFYHNLGAREATTEWIMKMDVDTLPNVYFFGQLLPVLAVAKEREWFNVGMVYTSQRATAEILADSEELVPGKTYLSIMSELQRFCDRGIGTKGIGGTNFVCPRHAYIELGGCLEKFQGWGWEDYQQVYMFEKFQQGKDPLPGSVELTNVTNRCKSEIARPKAKALWQFNPFLCLLHRWHLPSLTRQPEAVARNRRILLDYILSQK